MRVRFGCSPNVGFFGWLIRLGTFSHYGHAFLEVEYETTGKRVIYEGEPGGLRRSAAKAVQYESAGNVCWSPWLQLNASEMQTAVAYLAAVVGTKYDWLNIADFVLHLFGIKGHIDHDETDDKLICSVFVVKFWHKVFNVDLFPGKPDHRVSPGDLADLLTRHVPALYGVQ